MNNRIQERPAAGRLLRSSAPMALLALLALGPFFLSTEAARAASHEDGGNSGHDGGSGGAGGHSGSGGHDGGSGDDHAGGPGGPRGDGDPGVLPSAHDDDRSAPAAVGRADAALPPGTYAHFEFGLARSSFDDAYWLSPGYPQDPKVFFDLDGSDQAYGSAALGREWADGIRADLGIFIFGESEVSGPWSHTVPATPGPHASIEASVSTKALMATGYYFPLAAAGRSGGVQPYVSAGIGVARNEVDDWTRINPGAGRTERRFSGDTTSDLAWSVGGGVEVDLGTSLGGVPARLMVGYRYFDLGTAAGGAASRDGHGTPVEPLTFDHSEHVISVGVVIPLGG